MVQSVRKCPALGRHFRIWHITPKPTTILAMKLLIAGLATETNTFSPIPTGRLAFEDVFVGRNATALPPNLFSAPMHVWRDMADAEGWDVVESLAAFAQPAGLTIRATYEAFRDEILKDIAAAQPDMVLLTLHGAMIAEGYDDCEGDLCTRARLLVPDAVIGVEIDPHSHVTQAMMDAVDIIICYKEYPHTDSADRAREVFTLARDTALGQITPVMRDVDCQMITMYHTTRAPMRGFVDTMQEAEGQGGVLSLSLVHGFPWGDCARVGTRMLAITDGDGPLAEATAQRFASDLWGMRYDLKGNWPDIEGALDLVEAATEGPVVLADFADNAGGGAPADSTFVLRAALDRGMRDIALGIFWDPILVRMCQDVGIGGAMRVRLGGKVCAASGDPVDLDVYVRGIQTNMQQKMGPNDMAMGTGVWLEAEGIHLVVNDTRTQAFHPSAFTDLGLDLSTLRSVVVKSSQHFYAGFAPIASDVIYISGPGAITPDYAAIPYKKRDLNYWPRVEDPRRA